MVLIVVIAVSLFCVIIDQSSPVQVALALVSTPIVAEPCPDRHCGGKKRSVDAADEPIEASANAPIERRKRSAESLFIRRKRSAAIEK